MAAIVVQDEYVRVNTLEPDRNGVLDAMKQLLASATVHSDYMCFGPSTEQRMLEEAAQIALTNSEAQVPNLIEMTYVSDEGVRGPGAARDLCSAVASSAFGPLAQGRVGVHPADGVDRGQTGTYTGEIPAELTAPRGIGLEGLCRIQSGCGWLLFQESSLSYHHRDL